MNCSVWWQPSPSFTVDKAGAERGFADPVWVERRFSDTSIFFTCHHEATLVAEGSALVTRTTGTAEDRRGPISEHAGYFRFPDLTISV